MKKILILSLAAVSVLSVSAQKKLDPAAFQLATSARDAALPLARGAENYRALPSPIAPDEKVSVIITLQPGEDATVLEERGYEVLAMRDDMAIVLMSANEMFEAADMSQIKSIALGVETRELLCHAKEVTGVTTIHDGISEVGGKSFDGTGVVVGLMDSGLDINHPNFLNADGMPRASRLFVITGSNSSIRTYETPAQIAAYTTDDSDNDHATHVLGCMAGSYGNNGEKFTKAAWVNASTGNLQTGSNRFTAQTDYRGSATASDIAAACGTTQGNNIILAAEKIYSYAQSQGKPAVMNISLGHNYGPHDGTDATSRYLSSIGNDMIICVSAGNEGSDNITLSKDFTSGNTTLKTCPSTVASCNGMVDIWGSDNSIYKVTFQILNKTTGAVVWSYTVDKNLSEDVYITGSYYNMPTYLHFDEFDKAFGSQSALVLSTNVDPNNNRYNVSLNLQLSGGNNGFVPGIVIEGTAGKRVDVFGQGVNLYSNNISGYSNGNPDCTINGIATANNVIAVGAYVNQQKFPTFGGINGLSGIKEGEIADFSSYGTTFDGRVLPHVAGPGEFVISSISSYYTEKLDPNKDADIVMSTAYVDKTVNKASRRYYWTQMSGTSMSSPFVAGVVALWLEADPTLTYNDVLNVMKATSIKDALTEKNPNRFGAGRINALEGIKYVLSQSGIADIEVDASDFVVTPTYDRGFEIFAAGASNIQAELYNMSGAKVASVSSNGDTATLSAKGATPGVYILRSTTASGRIDSRKVVLK